MGPFEEMCVIFGGFYVGINGEFEKADFNDVVFDETIF